MVKHRVVFAKSAVLSSPINKVHENVLIILESTDVT